MSIKMEQCVDRIENVIANGQGLCFGFFKEGTKGAVTNQVAYQSAPCHGSLGNTMHLQDGEKAIFYTRIPSSKFSKKHLKETNDNWLKYILSAEGPYRSLVKDREVYISEKGAGYALEVHSGDDRPLLCNLAIASRVGYEYGDSIPIMRLLVEEHGFSYAEAHFLASFFAHTYGNSKDDYDSSLSLTGGYSTSGHAIISGSAHRRLFDLKAFEDGTPLTPKEKTMLYNDRQVFGKINAKFQRPLTNQNASVVTHFRQAMATPKKEEKEVYQSRWAIMPKKIESQIITAPLKEFVAVWRDAVRAKYFEDLGIAGSA